MSTVCTDHAMVIREREREREREFRWPLVNLFPIP